MILSIDPGTIGLGWAVFTNDGVLHMSGAIEIAQSIHWQERCRLMADRFDSQLYSFTAIERAVIEKPFIALEGKCLQAAKKQDVIKLTLVTGRIWQAIHSHFGNVAEFVDVMTWKGQMSKALTERRVKKRLPGLPEGISDHQVDAVGIGLWALGKF